MALKFPGMDPFIEGQRWEDFHLHLSSSIGRALSVQVRPRYDVIAERRVYVEHRPWEDETRRFVRPDVPVVESSATAGVARATVPSPTAGRGVRPFLLTLPVPEERREAFLTIRDRESRQVVTVIELLSPANKRRGSDGLAEYLTKREEVLGSRAHLVEVDLLRGGERLPTLEPLPPAAYYAFVGRGNRRPEVEVYAWELREPMPSIPVPLAPRDPDAALDLQALFRLVHEEMGYGDLLDYDAPVTPPMSDADRAWVREVLGSGV